LNRKIYWYVYKSLTPQPKLRLTFSPRMQGNKWLLLEQVVEDIPIIKYKILDETSTKNSIIIVENTWELISDILKELYESEFLTLDYLINNKVKIIVNLKKAGFNQNELFKLAEIIEEHDLQDLIVPRIN